MSPRTLARAKLVGALTRVADLEHRGDTTGAEDARRRVAELEAELEADTIEEARTIVAGGDWTNGISGFS